MRKLGIALLVLLVALGVAVPISARAAPLLPAVFAHDAVSHQYLRVQYGGGDDDDGPSYQPPQHSGHHCCSNGGFNASSIGSIVSVVGAIAGAAAEQHRIEAGRQQQQQYYQMEVQHRNNQARKNRQDQQLQAARNKENRAQQAKQKRENDLANEKRQEEIDELNNQKRELSQLKKEMERQREEIRNPDPATPPAGYANGNTPDNTTSNDSYTSDSKEGVTINVIPSNGYVIPSLKLGETTLLPSQVDLPPERAICTGTTGRGCWLRVTTMPTAGGGSSQVCAMYCKPDQRPRPPPQQPPRYVTPKPTPTRIPDVLPTPVVVVTPTPTPTPVVVVTPSPTPTRTPDVLPTPVVVVTPTPNPTRIPDVLPTPVVVATPTPTPTPTPKLTYAATDTDKASSYEEPKPAPKPAVPTDIATNYEEPKPAPKPAVPTDIATSYEEPKPAPKPAAQTDIATSYEEPKPAPKPAVRTDIAEKYVEAKPAEAEVDEADGRPIEESHDISNILQDWIDEHNKTKNEKPSNDKASDNKTTNNNVEDNISDILQDWINEHKKPTNNEPSNNTTPDNKTTNNNVQYNISNILQDWIDEHKKPTNEKTTNNKTEENGEPVAELDQATARKTTRRNPATKPKTASVPAKDAEWRARYKDLQRKDKKRGAEEKKNKIADNISTITNILQDWINQHNKPANEKPLDDKTADNNTEENKKTDPTEPENKGGDSGSVVRYDPVRCVNLNFGPCREEMLKHEEEEEKRKKILALKKKEEEAEEQRIDNPGKPDKQGCTAQGDKPLKDLLKDPQYIGLLGGLEKVTPVSGDQFQQAVQQALADKVRGMALGGMAAIPIVGSAISAVADVLWKDPDNDKLFDKMKAYVDQLVPDAITNERITQLQEGLGALRRDLSDYTTDDGLVRKGLDLNNLIHDLNTQQDHILSTATIDNSPEKTLSLVLAFGMLQLTALQEQYLRYNDYYKDTPGNHKRDMDKFNTAIEKYKDIAKIIKDKIIKNRLDKIYIENGDYEKAIGATPMGNIIYDKIDYHNTRDGFCDYVHGYDNPFQAFIDMVNRKNAVRDVYEKDLDILLKPLTHWPSITVPAETVVQAPPTKRASTGERQ